MPIHVRSRRLSVSRIKEEFPKNEGVTYTVGNISGSGPFIFDVTRNGPEPWCQLAPTYPHSNIPVPFSESVTSKTIAGIWEGTKVFERFGPDSSKFHVNEPTGLRRTERANGRLLGFRGYNSKGEEVLLSEAEARDRIYKTAFRWVFRNKVRELVEAIRLLSYSTDVILLDDATCEDTKDVTRPISTAALIRAEISAVYDNEANREYYHNTAKGNLVQLPDPFLCAVAARICRRMIASLDIDAFPDDHAVEMWIAWMRAFASDPHDTALPLRLQQRYTPRNVAETVNSLVDAVAQRRALATEGSGLAIVDYSTTSALRSALSSALSVGELVKQAAANRADSDSRVHQAFRLRQRAVAAIHEALASCGEVDGEMVAALESDIQRAYRECVANGSVIPGMLAAPDYLFLIPAYFSLKRVGDVVHIVDAIDARILRHFQEQPDYLFNLDPFQFEEVICEVVSAFGWNAAVTSRTKDGGFDILALDNGVLKNKYLIECKRYRKKPVGVQLVRSLHGVVEEEQATKGILVSTSGFTKPAQALLDKHSWKLEGCDFQRLLEWLEEYHRMTLVSSKGIIKTP